MPNGFLCPKCHGQRTTSCAVCSGSGKRLLAGVSIGACKECNGSGRQRCDVCGGGGEIEREVELEHAHGELRARKDLSTSWQAAWHLA
jgi:DnaJ-class molecular chaperone